MFASSSNPCIDNCVTDDVRDRIEPPLLGRLVGMVKIELIHELIERNGKIRFSRLGQSSNFGQGLWAGHNFFSIQGWLRDCIARASSLKRSAAAAVRS